MADYSVKNLVTWLETMPPRKGYDWSSARDCLLGQWAKANGARDPFGKSVELGNEDVFYRIALERIDRCTFGAALKRAKRELERAA